MSSSAQRRREPEFSPLTLLMIVNFATYFFFRDKLPINMKMLVFFRQNVFGNRKNNGCGQKKPEGTSCAIFGVETAANCCELKRCADGTEPTTKMKS